MFINKRNEKRQHRNEYIRLNSSDDNMIYFFHSTYILVNITVENYSNLITNLVIEFIKNTT